MPKIGDRVIYYTHEASDADHRSVDRLALVTAVQDDDCVDVVVFPPGGPVTFKRVCRYNPTLPVNQAGLSYWRGPDEKAPDFAEFRHSNDPRWHELRRRQREKMDRTPIRNRKELYDVQKGEQEDLDGQLDEEREGGNA